ncbi:hypothetical protein NQ317_019825 [Molorchus minor]|uniref:FERM domain-containing protein n=1 Tax=Molorchus minor TaxID=1323400 RepID=A0ABQ9J0N9_9CUCU|nr:hypothetical protein NQ317_019825 [Molorchus minor]
MRTGVSKTESAIRYPCTVQVTEKGKVSECKSDHTGARFTSNKVKEYWRLSGLLRGPTSKMKTVVSETGIEVLYPCTVHLLRNGEILECEYKSDHLGRDLLDYVCQYQNLSDKEYWGLRFVDVYDFKHWLELDQLIRPQVKSVCPIHFHFRAKVYPAEPHKIRDIETKHQFFMQLRYDLITGRLCCESNDAALILALILQYIHGDHKPEIHFGNYIKTKVLLNQTFTIEAKAIEIHKSHMCGYTKAQVEDLFLRMACQMETYGVDPHVVEDLEERKLNLWINHKGIVCYIDKKKEHHIPWMDITQIIQNQRQLLISATDKKELVFVCSDEVDCKYICRGVMDHLTFFTSSGRKSTVTIVGSDQSKDSDNGSQISTKNILDNDNKDVVSEASVELAVTDLLPENKSAKNSRCAFWLCSKTYVVHVAFFIFFVGVTWKFYSLLDKDSLGNGLIKQRVVQQTLENTDLIGGRGKTGWIVSLPVMTSLVAIGAGFISCCVLWSMLIPIWDLNGCNILVSSKLVCTSLELNVFTGSVVHLPLERPAAQVTREWFETGVLSGMGYQIGGLTEGLPADRAFVRFFTWKEDIDKVAVRWADALVPHCRMHPTMQNVAS